MSKMKKKKRRLGRKILFGFEILVLVLLVVPIQMGLERIFDRCAAFLERRAQRRAKRRNARRAFRGGRNRR